MSPSEGGRWRCLRGREGGGCCQREVCREGWATNQWEHYTMWEQGPRAWTSRLWNIVAFATHLLSGLAYPSCQGVHRIDFCLKTRQKKGGGDDGLSVFEHRGVPHYHVSKVLDLTRETPLAGMNLDNLWVMRVSMLSSMSWGLWKWTWENNQ